jgi:predicted AlkP superfamily phosphohydrolase/phosphomutase
MNGVMISGFVSIDFDKSVYPPELIPRLKGLDYRLDVDAQKAHDSMDMFLSDLDKTLEARIKAYRYLWDSYDWQVFMLVFTGTDRLLHFLWDAYEDKGHQYHKAFVEHFKRIDEAIGEIKDKISDDDVLIMLSDHGFEKLEKDVYINYLLASKGFLSFKPGSEPNLANIGSATKAFALDPARIYVNLKGKYPEGSVVWGEKEALVKDLEEVFSSLQIDGRKVIKHIYRKEDVYEGPYADQACDLVLIAEKGFNLKGAMAATELAGKGVFTGKHTYHDAFLLINNKDVVSGLGDNPSVIDAGKLIKSLVAGN